MTDYNACAIVEGFDGMEHDQKEEQQAWAHLIKTGLCWKLQGWYGRSAMDWINAGLIDKEGNILKEVD